MLVHNTLRAISISMIIALSAFPAIAQAQDGQYKIGVVNLKVVFDEFDKQKSKYDELKSELSARITADKAKFEDESSKLSADEKKALQDKIEADFSKYKAAVQQSQEEIDRKEKRIFEEIITDIQIAVEEVGAKENYHLVFDGGKNRNNNLLYYSTTLNMTQKVIDHLNK
jgi:Skp family chaperone for outer membrane proteins